MSRTTADGEAWKRIVLRSMPLPAWLDEDGPQRAIVLSTRVRLMRNLRGYRFPHLASPDELRSIFERIRTPFAAREFQVLRNASPMERDYLVACRLISPDFDWKACGRALVVDPARAASAMINEEDHLRIQALVPGWSFRNALRIAEDMLGLVEQEVEFARSDSFGYLAASPSNCGEGRRYSAMLHLIGLAHIRKLGETIKALLSQGLIVRGLFGERSRAIGAFVQVSTTATSVPNFVGACEYLLEEESRARNGVSRAELEGRLAETTDFIHAAKGISLADALRVLAWIRWQQCGQGNAAGGARYVDALIPELALLESLGEPRGSRSRIDAIRKHAQTGIQSPLRQSS